MSRFPVVLAVLSVFSSSVALAAAPVASDDARAVKAAQVRSHDVPCGASPQLAAFPFGPSSTDDARRLKGGEAASSGSPKASFVARAASGASATDEARGIARRGVVPEDAGVASTSAGQCGPRLG